jgi:hypothetical protein
VDDVGLSDGDTLAFACSASSLATSTVLSSSSTVVENGSCRLDLDDKIQEERVLGARPPKMTMTLQTQQIRHAMAEIRALYADRTAPVLSRQLTSLPMTVQEICFSIVLDKHKQRRVQVKSD